MEAKYSNSVVNPEMMKFLRFLEANKKFVGLSDWKILIVTSPTHVDSGLAEAEADIYEYEIKVTVSPDFVKLSEKRQANILFHELVHARHSIFNIRVEKLTDEEEEYLINDLVRGFERMSGGKFEFEVDIVEDKPKNIKSKIRKK